MKCQRPLREEDEGQEKYLCDHRTVDNDVSVAKILKQYSSSPRRASFCTLFGHRQAGKSTRLRSLNETLEGQGFTVVYLDMRQVLTEPTEFYATLAGAMALGFPENHRIDAEEMAALLRSLPTTVAGLQSLFAPKFNGLFARKAEGTKGIILLVEEMDALQCHEQFFAAFSTMLEHVDRTLQCNEQLEYVLCGAIGYGVHRIVRLSNPGATSSRQTRSWTSSAPTSRRTTIVFSKNLLRTFTLTLSPKAA
ncbi:hypothetical protein QOT17_004900 [Balamuthia mandrillaris]